MTHPYDGIINALDQAAARLLENVTPDGLLARVADESGVAAAMHLPLDIAMKRAKLAALAAETERLNRGGGVVVVPDIYGSRG